MQINRNVTLSAAIKKAVPARVPVVEFDYHFTDAAYVDAIVEQVMHSATP